MVMSIFEETGSGNLHLWDQSHKMNQAMNGAQAIQEVEILTRNLSIPHYSGGSNTNVYIQKEKKPALFINITAGQ